MDTPSVPPVISPPPVPPVMLPPPGPRKPGGFGALMLKVFVVAAVLFAGFILFRTVQFVQWSRTHKYEPRGFDFFVDATSHIGPQGTAASGNSEQATELAAEMSKVMAKLRNEGFTQAKEKAFLDKQDVFKTYCELGSNQCIFLVHIPELRRFVGDAQDELAKETWTTAQKVLTEAHAGTNGMKLAVAIRGVVFYERTMTGRLAANPDARDAGLEHMEKGVDSQKIIYDWFLPAETNSPPQGIPQKAK